MDKKYKDFFNKSPNPTSKILSFFNEEIKDVILKIKASDTLDWYEYQNILDKYKDFYEVKVAILRNENTPTPIYDLILDEELKKSAPNKFVLFECLKHYVPSIKKLDNAIFFIGDEMIEKELNNAFVDGRETVFHKEVVADMQDHFAERFNGYQFYHGKISGSILSKLVFDLKTNEEILTAVCNNPYIKATQRDKIFDMGCNFYNITNYTPHMIEEIYKSCADTIFDIEITNDDMKENILKANGKMTELMRDEKLSANLFFDLVCRIKTCEFPSNFPYANIVLEDIATYCKIPEVLEQIESMTVRTMFNPHTPKHLLDKKANIITDGLLRKTMDVENSILTIRNYVPKIDLGIKNMFRIIRETKPKIFQTLAEFAETPKIILKEIGKIDIDERYKFLCNINVRLKDNCIDMDFQKQVMKLLTSTSFVHDFNISSDPDVGIPLKTDQYNRILNIIETEILHLKDEKLIKEFEIKLGDFKAGYQFRDMSVDFPSYYIKPKDLDVLTDANGTQSMVLRPDLTKDEIETFLKSVKHPDTLLAPKDEIFYTLDTMNDRVALYETIDQYMNIVNTIDEYVLYLQEKEKEFEQER